MKASAAALPRLSPQVPTASWRFMLGRLASGAEADKGQVLHLVDRGTDRARCGARPGPRSVGWAEDTDNDQRIIGMRWCPRCRKMESLSVPQIGDGVTRYFYTDRASYTVIAVVTPNKIMVRRDKCVRTDDNGMSDSQQYRYEQDPSGEVLTITRRKGDKWMAKEKGSYFRVGLRGAYHDYSF